MAIRRFRHRRDHWGGMWCIDTDTGNAWMEHDSGHKGEVIEHWDAPGAPFAVRTVANGDWIEVHPTGQLLLFGGSEDGGNAPRRRRNRVA